MKRAKRWIGFGLSVLLLFQPVGYVNAEESSGESQEQILSLAEVSTEVNLDIGEKKEENIYYTVAPEVTRPQDILCISSDESIASIEAIAGDARPDGLLVRIRITGKATGHADMTVSLNETGTILEKHSVEVSDNVYNDETNEYGILIIKGNCGASQTDRLTWAIYDTDENGIGDTLVIDGLGAMKDYYSTSAPWQAYKESLEQLILGPGVTHIGEYAFSNCTNLTGNLFLSEVLTSIGRYAFYKCNFYGHLVIPNSVTTIGNSAFRDCKAFSGLSLSDNLSKIESSVFQGCGGFTGNLIIPNSVTSIEFSAFSDCSNFTGDLVIPDSVTNIESYAFAYWWKLRGKLTLSSELKSIPEGCFYMSGFTGDLLIPQNITSIESFAFGGNKFTGELKLPGKLKRISQSAFTDCEYLSGKVVLPETVESIGGNIFSRCSQLNGIVILNRKCNIAGGESAIPADFKIYGYEASTAQEYATTYGRTFIKDHDYGSPQFAWTGNNECSAKFTCSICGDVQTVKCIVSGKKTIDATCTKDGQTAYTAACKFGYNNKEKEYTDTKTVNNAVLGHKFGQPTFTWANDNACKATSKCDRCKESITKKCTVTNKVKKEATCKDSGVTVYTAVYKGEDGKEYTNTKEVETSVKDHKYEYTNNEDGTHTVVCKVGGEKKTEQCSYRDKMCTKCGGKQKTTNLPYKDVKPGVWYHEAVTYVYDNGIMTGFANGNFGPADNLGRGQFATILYRMEENPNTEYQAIFPDVSNGQFYSIPASWAYNTGVISGYNNGYFGPADTMTREQLATMMYRYAKHKGYNVTQKANLERYPDYRKVSSFSNEAMQWAVGVGLISGDQGKLNPQGTASRAVTSVIIQRFMKAYQ